MGPGALRGWAIVHGWTSLACTVFLLVLCLTGLPLIFHAEIAGWLEPHVYADLPPDGLRADLDRIVAAGRALYPGEIVTAISIDDDEPQIHLWMAPSWPAVKADQQVVHFIRFDARTGVELERSVPPGQRPANFMRVVESLHTDLFAGLAGEMFLAAMGLLFVAAIVSGIVLYGPFARRLEFGTIRRDRSARLKWLDLHNLLGIATVAWALVVGATGMMNELTTPLFSLWQRTDVAAMLAGGRSGGTAVPATLSSVQAAYVAAHAAAPGMTVVSVVFPGAPFGTPQHYFLWTKGQEALTSRLFSPVMVDARDGRVAGMVVMPWYLQLLELCRPLHFGDYGGLPLKVIWALFDLVTIVVLASGIYLWIGRRR